jgi:hypothetical protein
MDGVRQLKNGVKNVLEKRYLLAQTYLIFATLLVPSIRTMLSSNSIKIAQFRITETQSNVLLPFFVFLIMILGYLAFISKKKDLTKIEMLVTDIIALIASFSLSVVIALPAALVGAAYYGNNKLQLLIIVLTIIITLITSWSLIITPGELKKL